MAWGFTISYHDKLEALRERRPPPSLRSWPEFLQYHAKLEALRERRPLPSLSARPEFLQYHAKLEALRERKKKWTRRAAVKVKGVCFGGSPREDPYRVIGIFGLNLYNLGEKLMTVSSLSLSRGGLQSNALRRRPQSGDVRQKGGQNI